eukprot:m.192207 g.192207  ORF g.192207 m.192207 type:complete len:455 (-) comp15165_c0_seq1:308-1672(-)
MLASLSGHGAAANDPGVGSEPGPAVDGSAQLRSPGPRSPHDTVELTTLDLNDGTFASLDEEAELLRLLQGDGDSDGEGGGDRTPTTSAPAASRRAHSLFDDADDEEDVDLALFGFTKPPAAAAPPSHLESERGEAGGEDVRPLQQPGLAGARLDETDESSEGSPSPPPPRPSLTNTDRRRGVRAQGLKGSTGVRGGNPDGEGVDAPLPPGHRAVVLERRSKHDPLGLDVSVKAADTASTATGAPIDGGGGSGKGVRITVRSVKPGSLAARGGVRVGDVIASIQGVSVSQVYYKEQCLELLRESTVRLVLATATEEPDPLPPMVVVAPTGPSVIVKPPPAATQRLTKDVEIVVDRGGAGAQTSLGVEVSLQQQGGAMQAFIKHVQRDGAAGRHGVLPNDRILAINDHDVDDLPAGSAGRIYLFRLLGSGDVTLLLRRVVTVQGYTDHHGNFVPRE